jgi:PAS domain S-box-containing protein
MSFSPSSHPHSGTSSGRTLPQEFLSDYLKLVNHAAQSAAFSASRPEAVREIATAAAQISQGVALVYLRDRGEPTYSKVYATEEPAHTLPQHLPASLSAYIERTLLSTAPFPADLQSLTETYKSGELALLPLRSGLITMGLLIVLRPERGLTDTVMDLLQLLGTQLAAFLDNNELFHVLEIHAFEMAQLSYITRISTSSMDLDTVTDVTSRLLTEILDVNKVVLAHLDQRGLIPLGAFQDAPFSLNSIPEVHHLITHKNPSASYYLLNPNTDTGNFRPPLSAPLRHLMEAMEASMLLLVPLVANMEMFGVMLVFSQRTEIFPERQMQLLETAANQIAVQLYNAFQYTRTRNELNRRLGQLALLEDMAGQISTTLQLDAVIEKVLESAMRASNAQAASLALPIEGENDTWQIFHRESSGDQRRMQRHTGTLDSFTQQAVTTKQTVSMNVSDMVNTFAGDKSFVAVPLERERELVGVLSVEDPTIGLFTQEEITFLHSLSRHAVISIENARLVEEHRYQIAALRALQGMNVRLSTASTRQSVLMVVLDTARDLMWADGVALFHVENGKNQVNLSHSIGEQPAIMRQSAQRTKDSGEIKIHERSGKPGTLINVPIRSTHGNRVTDILTLWFAQGRRVRQRDLSSLMLLSNQVGGFLETTALYEQVRAAGEKMNVILSSVREGMILIDREGIVMEANPAAEQLLSVNKYEILNKPLVNLLYKLMDDNGQSGYTRAQISQFLKQLRHAPDSTTQHEFTRMLNSQPVHIQEMGTPVRNEFNQIIGRLLVFRDITEERMLTEYREEITSMIIHDLRGPLWSVISAIDLAQGDLEAIENTHTATKMLELSSRSANQLMRLVDSLLDIRRLEKRELPLRKTHIHVQDLMDQVRIAVQGTLDDGEIRLTVRLDTRMQPIFVDPDIIRRVLINLLDNACRYTPTRGLILIEATAHNDTVMITIADSGPGIPISERERVFEPYRQAKANTPERGTKGSGLGLAFCKLAVEAHGGTIWIDNQSPLSGACFAVKLPVSHDQAVTASSGH